MDKKQQNQIKRKLREVWLFSKTRAEAISNAKVKVEVGVYKNSNKKYRTYIKCQRCGSIVDKNNKQVDHIIPVEPSSSWDEYIQKLFCDVSNLQCLCLTCHKEKTYNENI